MAADELVALRPRDHVRDVRLGDVRSLIFDVIDVETRKVSGELSLRIGESESLFYLGHIGYHIDPPFRGRHAALHACRLSLPFLLELGMRSVVITTDEDNGPSIRTCERLGCVLESTVDVPRRYQAEFSISARKRRYVLEISET